MNNIQMKLENPNRLEELSPDRTLRRIGLLQGHVFCDIGAGTGIFSLPAARITGHTVYALDINDEMLRIIAKKANDAGLKDIVPVKVLGDDFALPDGLADVVLLAAVLHEIPDQSGFLERVKKLLKNEGKLAVIEFHKSPTVFGPPAHLRMSCEETEAVAQTAGFSKAEAFDLGANYYCMVFQ